MGFLKKWIRPLSPIFFKLSLYTMKVLGKKTILIFWNRGLGDIALGLFGLNQRIKEIIPDAKITYYTRQDLKQGFELLNDCQTIVDVTLQRGKPFHLDQRFFSLYDTVILNPNPTDWLLDQLHKVVPTLYLKELKQPGAKEKIAIHVQTETGQFYGYEKNWPIERFIELIRYLNQKDIRPVLLGVKKDDHFSSLQVEDWRGEKELNEVLTCILQECSILIAPDSGILSLVYYLNHQVDLLVISLWSDPRQGILKHGVGSPNQRLKNIPLIEKNLKNLSVERVIDAIERK